MRWNKPTKGIIIILGILLFCSSSIIIGKNFRYPNSPQLYEFQLNHQIPRRIKAKQYSDKVLIKSLIKNLEKSVRENDIEKFSNLISEDVIGEDGKTIGKRNQRNKFDEKIRNFRSDLILKYSKRRKPGKDMNNKLYKKNGLEDNWSDGFPFWDFNIDVNDIKDNGNGRFANVTCVLYCKFDQPEDIPDIIVKTKNKMAKSKIDDTFEETGKFKKKPLYREIKLRLRKDEKKWKIVNLDDFFEYYEKRLERLKARRSFRNHLY